MPVIRYDYDQVFDSPWGWFRGHNSEDGPTPWGDVQNARERAPGILEVETPGHGGLVMSEARWKSLPEEVREKFLNRGFAEEDCEMPVALALLGLATPVELEWAYRVTHQYPRYQAAQARVGDRYYDAGLHLVNR